MTFGPGDSLTPLEDLLERAVQAAVDYTDAQLNIVEWTDFTPTASAGFTTGTCRYRRFGQFVELRLTATYSGATVTGNSQGNLADTEMFTGVGYPTGILPSQMLFPRARKSPVGTVMGINFYTSGRVVITDTYPTQTLSSGDIIELTSVHSVG